MNDVGDIMKKIKTIIIALLLFGIIIVSSYPSNTTPEVLSNSYDYSDQTPNNPDENGHWDPVSITGHDNSTHLSLYGTDVIATSSLAFLGATWSANHRWQFGYEIVENGYSGNEKLINGAGIYITEKTNANNLYFFPGTDSADIGSTPESGSTNVNYEDIAYAAAGVAVSLLNNYTVSVVWSLTSFINLLKPKLDSATDSGSQHVRSWYWSSLEKKVGEFFHFYFEVDPNYDTSFEYQYVIFGPGYEALSAGLGCRTLKAGEAGSFSSINPELMNDEELKNNNIIKIPINQLQSQYKELNIPESTVKELIKSNVPYCFYTRSISESETPYDEYDENTLNKQSLIMTINRMIDRSNIIIDAYTNNNISDEYNKNIIIKHENKIKEYNYYIEQINSNNLSKEEMLELYKVLKEEGKGWL